MIDFASALLILSQRKPTLLSLDIQRKLVRLGLDNIHHTTLAMGRECGQKLLLRDPPGGASVYMLLGSVYHKAAEQEDVSYNGKDPAFWESLFEQVKSNQNEREGKEVRYLLGGDWLKKSHVDRWCQMMAAPSWVGLSLSDIIERVAARITEVGITVLEREKHLSYTDGQVQFDGTLDVLGMSRLGKIILDYKTSGLWGPLIGEFLPSASKSIKAQTWDMGTVQIHTQLRHYEWLLGKMGVTGISAYGLVFPANCVPGQRGSKAGGDRGPIVVAAPTYSRDFHIQYERDLVATLNAWANGGLIKTFPTEYGKPACESCRFFGACMGKMSASVGTMDVPAVSNYIGGYDV